VKLVSGNPLLTAPPREGFHMVPSLPAGALVLRGVVLCHCLAPMRIRILAYILTALA